jgi:hypothetical protein
MPAGPPGGLGEVPPGNALVCVGDRGEYVAPGYIITEAEPAVWTDSANEGRPQASRPAADRVGRDVPELPSTAESVADLGAGDVEPLPAVAVKRGRGGEREDGVRLSRSDRLRQP